MNFCISSDHLAKVCPERSSGPRPMPKLVLSCHTEDHRHGTPLAGRLTPKNTACCSARMSDRLFEGFTAAQEGRRSKTSFLAAGRRQAPWASASAPASVLFPPPSTPSTIPEQLPRTSKKLSRCLAQVRSRESIYKLVSTIPVLWSTFFIISGPQI